MSTRDSYERSEPRKDGPTFGQIKYLKEQAVAEQKGQPLTCREASPLSVTRYIACGATATRFILSEHGKKVYPMCPGCASHNVKNRDCEDVGPI